MLWAAHLQDDKYHLCISRRSLISVFCEQVQWGGWTQGTLFPLHRSWRRKPYTKENWSEWKLSKNWSTYFLRFLHHPINEEPDESCVKVRVDVSNLLPSESPMSGWKWQVRSNEENPKQRIFWREGTWIKDLWIIKTVVLFRGNLVAKSFTLLI